MTLARRIGALFAVAAVALLAAITASIVITDQNRAASTELVDRITPSRRMAGDLLTALVEQQNDIRGYALRGAEISLQEHREQLSRQESSATELRDLLSADPALREGLDRTLQAADQWRRDAAEPIIETVTRSGPRPQDDELYQVEQQGFRLVETAAKGLQADLQGAHDRAAARVDALDRLEVAVLVVSGLVIAGVLAAATVLLRRWVSTPLAALAADARRVAGGDYEHQVSAGNAPPEIAAMAADVEAMRRRIVADRDTLAASALDLERSNGDLEQFAFVASHDLQEPLRKVSSFCQLLQRRYGGQLDERADQYIGFAVDGAQRMQQLINDLLAFSRVGRTTAGFVPVELATVVHAAVAGLDAIRERSRTEVVVDELPVILGDPSLLTQLMANLIGNGLKFCRAGVPPRIEIGARPAEDGCSGTDGRSVPGGWEIWVEDNGIGIDPEYADKVFLIFQRLHARDRYPGTGIGLALAKKIVEFHGGRIWLDTGHDRHDGSRSDGLRNGEPGNGEAGNGEPGNGEPQNDESARGATIRIWLPALTEEAAQ
ncbi:MAG: sensor histidine kinase [Pseudonocardiaceae bacterium]